MIPDITVQLTPAQQRRVQQLQNNIAVVTAVRDQSFALLLEAHSENSDFTNWVFELKDDTLIAHPPTLTILQPTQ